MPSKKLVQVDAETGELLEGFVACVFTGKNGFCRWFAASQEAFGLLGRSRPQAMECWVLFLLLEQVTIGNEVWVRQKDLAEVLGVSPVNVNRAVAKLVERGVLLKQGRGRYRLNPSICWRGKGNEHRKEMASVPKIPVGKEVGTDNEGTSASEKKRRTGS